MGRKSKASLACLGNLKKASLGLYQTTVKDVPESDTDDLVFIPSDTRQGVAKLGTDDGTDLEDMGTKLYFIEDDFSDDSDSESDCDSEFKSLEWDENEEAEIRDEAALLTFVVVLWKAQETADEAEWKKWGERKQPRHYSRNSA